MPKKKHRPKQIIMDDFLLILDLYHAYNAIVLREAYSVHTARLSGERGDLGFGEADRFTVAGSNQQIAGAVGQQDRCQFITLV